MKEKSFKPLLASPITDINKLNFPVIASVKLDGIRTILHPELGPVTRNLKPIPNRYIREKLKSYCHLCLDGEIIIGEPNAKDVFQKTSSGVMSFDGEPEFTYYVFDSFKNPEDQYFDRHSSIIYNSPFIEKLNSIYVQNVKELNDFESGCVEEQYEGVMVRDPYGKYKFGRSTEKEGILLKLKRFSDCEVTIIGFEEKFSNENEQTKDELGYSKRSSCKEGMVAANTLGALVVEHPDWGTFKVGSGFDDSLRDEIWNNKDKYLGKLAKIKYQSSGIKDKPRFPTFIFFRHENDM